MNLSQSGKHKRQPKQEPMKKTKRVKELTLNDFQAICETTDVGTSAQDCLEPGWLYYVLGVAGETGELAEKIKKLFRDKKGVIDDEFKDGVAKEIGDVMWYLARLADNFGISFNDIAQMNVDKLASRYKRNKLHGDGDNR